MPIHVLARRTAGAGLLLIVVLLLMVAGCSDDTDGGTATTASSSTTAADGGTTTTTDGTTTSSAPVELSEWDKELAKTAAVQAELSQVLIEENAPKDDPRMAIVYGLRARTQAISSRQALDKEDMELADSAMLQVHYILNESRGLGTGTTAQSLADARAIVENLGAPSRAPEEAAGILDELIEALAPLIDEALANTPTATTTP